MESTGWRHLCTHGSLGRGLVVVLKATVVQCDCGSLRGRGRLRGGAQVGYEAVEKQGSRFNVETPIWLK